MKQVSNSDFKRIVAYLREYTEICGVGPMSLLSNRERNKLRMAIILLKKLSKRL